MAQTKEEYNAKAARAAREKRAAETPEEKAERNAKKRARKAARTSQEKAEMAAYQKKYREDHREEITAKRTTPEAKEKAKKNNRARTLRRNPDAEYRFTGTNAERFEHFLDRTVTVPIDDRAVPDCPEDPCLTGWTAIRDRYGYPRMALSGVGVGLAHRWLWANEHGEIPKDLFVTHLCNNGHLGCLQIYHLQADTPMHNSADRVQNRTTLRSLSPPTVRGIRLLHSLGHTNRAELARLYETTRSVVQGIVEGKNYKEVTL